MTRSSDYCQHFFRSRRSTTWQTLGTIFLSLSCLGCWQEVRYEPDKTVQSASKASPIEPKMPETGSEELTSVSASDEKIVEQVEIAQVPVDESEETFTAQPAIHSPDTAYRLLATWRMCSEWSMAAALQAKGLDEQRYGVRLELAHGEAQRLGIDLPVLPSYEEGADRLSQNLTFLLAEAGPRLASELNNQYGIQLAALAELATKTHVLLLCYTPSSTRLEPVMDAIHQAAKSSGLPESVWRELVDLLAARADFKHVKAAIFQLHLRVLALLSEESVRHAADENLPEAAPMHSP